MTLAALATLLDGGRLAFGLLITLGFLKLRRATGDRLYLAFALAFVLLAVSDCLVGLHVAVGEFSAVAFLPRLLAFLVIIFGIVDKNRRSR